jgi:cell division septum initiation protein DivIVA
MADEPQVVSVSSSTQVSPEEIAHKSFPAARRGVDGEAVRAFLSKVAAELRDTLAREETLRERVAEAERRVADPELDEATLTRAIGVETAKILSTAHEAARNVVALAEQRATELIGESERVLAEQVAIAQAEALSIRTAAEQGADEYATRAQAEADALTDEAHSDAVELLDATKEECRRMVAEARDLRNRTLADLMARRRDLRVQLEELRAGKDSLLRVVDAVAAAVDALRERLVSAEDEARVAAEQAGEALERQPGHDELSELEEELAAAGRVLDEGAGAVGETVETIETVEVGAPEEGQVLGEDVPVKGGTSASRRSVDELFARIRASRAAEEAALRPPVAEAPTPEEDATSAGQAPEAPELVEEQGEEQAKVAGDTGDPGERDGQSDGTVAEVAEIEVVTAAGESVGADSITEVGVFERGADAEASEAAASSTPGARSGSETVFDAEAEEPADQDPVAPEMETLRDTVAIPVIKPPDVDAMTEPDVESLARRDHLLGAVTAKLGRALKRALQDDQNELLNALRQTSRKPVLDELVPQEVQRDRFVAAASDQLARAYEAGAAFLVTGDAVEGPSVSAPPPAEKVALEAGSVLAAELADDLSAMLRQRIEEALSELDGSLEGSADAAGIAYREWKGSRVEGLAGDFTTRAFAVGELAVLESVSNGGAPFVRWAVEDDDGGGSCPDCDDNSLAGPLLPGTAFPTGHSHPPVHPGCRCLLVPVRS